jgi:membrane protein implicated in regulation of membrane protease activity
VTGLYLFAAAAGVPLVAWFLFSGEDCGSDGDAGVAGVMFRLLPLSTIAFVLAAFGVAGLALGAAGASGGGAFAGAAVAGVVAGVLNSTLFGYLRRSESTTEVDDDQLAGKIGRVVVPLTGDRRGRIAVTVGGQQIHLSALATPDSPAELGVGDSVLVVEVRKGIASVTSLDPELNQGVDI